MQDGSLFPTAPCAHATAASSSASAQQSSSSSSSRKRKLSDPERFSDTSDAESRKHRKKDRESTVHGSPTSPSTAAGTITTRPRSASLSPTTGSSRLSPTSSPSQTPLLCDGDLPRSPEPRSLPCSPDGLGCISQATPDGGNAPMLLSPRGSGAASPLRSAVKRVLVDDCGKCTLHVAKGSDIHKITILSDLHIGVAGSGTCTFSQTSDTIFSNYIWSLTTMEDVGDEAAAAERVSDLVVINGDCFELWAPGPSGSGKPGSKDLFETIKKSWPNTCGALLDQEGDRVVMLNGNHDATMRTKGMFDKCYADLIVDDFSLYAAHGHQSDVWCADGSALLGISKLATRAYGKAELIQHDVDENSDALQKTIMPKDAVRRCDYRAMAHAEAVAKTLKCQVVAYGHTHMPLLLGTKDVMYCNSGCCCYPSRERRNTVDQLDITRRDVDHGRAGIERVVRAELSRVDLVEGKREVLAVAERVVYRVVREL